MTAAPQDAPRARLRQLDADTVVVEPRAARGADTAAGEPEAPPGAPVAPGVRGAPGVPGAPGGVLIEARCPHRGGLLRHAHVNAAATRLVCPLHRSTFDLTDEGAQLSGPPCRALRVRQVPANVSGPLPRQDALKPLLRQDAPGDAAVRDG